MDFATVHLRTDVFVPTEQNRSYVIRKNKLVENFGS